MTGSQKVFAKCWATAVDKVRADLALLMWVLVRVRRMELRRAFEDGQKERQLMAPDALGASAGDKRRSAAMRAAFKEGRDTATPWKLPDELEDDPALPEPERKERKEARDHFAQGIAARDAAPPDARAEARRQQRSAA
eukprot:gene46786-53767_t